MKFLLPLSIAASLILMFIFAVYWILKYTFIGEQFDDPKD